MVLTQPAFITKILYRFWGGRINQLERSRKQHRVCISEIRLDFDYRWTQC